MYKLVQILAFMLVVLATPKLTFGQPSSTTQSTDDQIIGCRFGYTQVVKFNVIGKGKKEASNLRHTDILIYENGKQQELVFFKVTEESDIKNLGYRYAIGYDPANQSEDGKYRTIKIIVKSEEGKRLKTQSSLKGYHATKGYFKY